MSSLGGFTGEKGNSLTGNRGTVGRTLADVFSGAAANIKSKFSHLSAISNVVQTSCPTPEQSIISSTSASTSIPLSINHNHGLFRDLSRSPTTYKSKEESLGINTPSYSQQYNLQSQPNSFSEATNRHLVNNKSVEHLAPNALPITVPGADVSDGLRDFSGLSIEPSSTTPISSVQSTTISESQSQSFAFGMN